MHLCLHPFLTIVLSYFYHLTQSTWRKVQALGLATAYKSDDNLRLFCGMIDALAFLPLADVTSGMAYLHTITPENATQLKHKY